MSDKSTNENVEKTRDSFPNMTSLIQYEIWEKGESKVAASGGGIQTAKARAAGQLLVEWGLATVRKEGNLLIFMAVPGERLDRQTRLLPPDDVEAWV